MKTTIKAQWPALPTTGVRHVKTAIKQSMPAHFQPVQRPDAGKQVGTILSATVLAASLMFGGMERLTFNIFSSLFCGERCM